MIKYLNNKTRLNKMSQFFFELFNNVLSKKAKTINNCLLD